MKESMIYSVELKPIAQKDLKELNKYEQIRILEKVLDLENGLIGDVKKLTDFSPEYRLRVGNFRVLFEVENNKIIIYRILPRKDAYKRR